MRIITTIAFLIFSFAAVSQYNIVIEITRLPTSTPTEKVYLAGNFNNWNPKDENYRLQLHSQDRYAIILKNVAANTYEFKFTQGAWEKVETTADGKNIANRTVTIVSDTVLMLSIDGWSEGKPREIMHTATPEVHILDSNFHIPQLNRDRRIWIYLPKGYNESKEKYPVLYMHDGQNLFDAATSPFGEWGVDEALDSAVKKCIVVGIDNGQVKRMNEYNPYEYAKFGKGEGDQYIDFLAKTLKPYIDKKFRTKKDSEHTTVAGSSMGGLISLYAAIKYPKVFGKAGVFSPAFQTSPKLLTDIPRMVSRSKHKKLRIYFYAGEQESKEMVPNMLGVFELMRKHAGAKMEARINAEGKHNEPTWRQEFPTFYNWIMN
ncbi:MAG TPA: alpha/beta hydrolase-fold protein [Chitinophagaceae bacterium]|nr:alpha/beta hydrolase-fold protein [Chitinophagaceae bacterium]